MRFRKSSYFSFVVIIMILLMGFQKNKLSKKYPTQLSAWDFFEQENLALLTAKEHTIPYQLQTPLFSDYAQKARFIKLPKGKKMKYEESEVLDFPIGTVLIKNFYYDKDMRRPEQGRTLLETRLLIHEEAGWEAISYVWNEDQTDAYLDLAGSTKVVRWIDQKGKKQKTAYQIPNKNQCKGCHNINNTIQPIGPKARQLNSPFLEYGIKNQLEHWAASGLLEGLPDDKTAIPTMAKWDDPAASLDARARAWLDINCAHCHRKEGPASTSGLFLNLEESNPTALGIYKTPIAAGRGSGGKKYSIEPGKPNKSILVYRMASTDPGVMMPEIARTMVHKEGLQLIKDWIKEMPKQ